MLSAARSSHPIYHMLEDVADDICTHGARGFKPPIWIELQHGFFLGENGRQRVVASEPPEVNLDNDASASLK
ncbi:hypothetical protein FQZ97_1057630 [compost metagenome]